MEAQAISLDLAVVEAAPEEDEAALGRLAAWCIAYAPLVAPDPPDGVFVEIAGASHLLGGEAALLADLTRRLRAAGFSAHAAVADTPGTAWAIARFARGQSIIPHGEQGSALSDLPVRALRLAAEVAEGLHALGIERIGQLTTLPRAALNRRFAAALGRLDQALGRTPEPLAYLDPPEIQIVRRVFAEPIGAPETVTRVVAELAEALARNLERQGLGARRLDLVCLRVDGQPQSLSIGTARPSRNARHLARLFEERLGLIDPGFGIETMLLVAGRVEPLQAHQLRSEFGQEGQDDPAAMAELVDRLGSRLGPGRIFRAAPVESEWPERSVRRVAALAPANGANWAADAPRPARLLDPPVRVEVMAMLPDHPPVRFVWRGQNRRVARIDGPERLYGQWWSSPDETDAVRDYYRVEDETGARFWMFHDASEGGKWWLHGLGEA